MRPTNQIFSEAFPCHKKVCQSHDLDDSNHAMRCHPNSLDPSAPSWNGPTKFVTWKQLVAKMSRTSSWWINVYVIWFDCSQTGIKITWILSQDLFLLFLNIFKMIIPWSDVKTLSSVFEVRANAETPADVRQAREFGAEGIGLVRTEHMFFEGQRIVAMRRKLRSEDWFTAAKTIK